MSRPAPPGRNKAWLACLACCLGAWAWPAAAQTQAPAAAKAVSGGVPWASLTPTQKAGLAPLQAEWSSIDPAQQQKWLEIAARMPSMQPEERQRIQQRMNEWVRMSPQERGRARLQFQEARQVSPEQRQARWDAYMALPEEERRALAKSATTVPKATKAGITQPQAGAVLPQQGISASKSSVSAPVTTVAPLKSVAPTVVQAKPGASTVLVTQTPAPPAHAQPGQPRIVAAPTVVDRGTLLPKPQAQEPGANATPSVPVAAPHAAVAPTPPALAAPASPAPAAPAPAASATQ